MKAPGTQDACNSFLIPLKVKKKKKIATHPHEQKLEVCSIYCTAEE